MPLFHTVMCEMNLIANVLLIRNKNIIQRVSGPNLSVGVCGQARPVADNTKDDFEALVKGANLVCNFGEKELRDTATSVKCPAAAPGGDDIAKDVECPSVVSTHSQHGC